MTIGETIRKAIKELSEGIMDMISFKEFTLDDGVSKKPKRARTKKGRYIADDPTTKDYNEAYVGGKAPTRKQLLGLKKKRIKK
tara:strand:- start:87 stop:335 length:249 start_codon:yes stop_codon:yes gene_type:complete